MKKKSVDYPLKRWEMVIFIVVVISTFIAAAVDMIFY